MPDIRQIVLIRATAEKIFQAITTPEGLAAWWTPDTKAEPELNSIARFGFGPTYFKEMKIVELQSPLNLKWVCMKGAEEWIDTTISFTLQPGDKAALSNFHPELADQISQANKADHGTVLSFQHNDWKEYSPMFAECSYTWAQFLNGLKLLCETGKGRPWPNQHRVE